MTEHKTLSFIFARSITELQGSVQRAMFRIWNIAMLLLSAMGICLISLLLAVSKYGSFMFAGYFIKPVILLLNYIPILLMQFIFFCIFNRQWAAFLANSFIFVSASIGNCFKLLIRGEPFSFSDLGAIGAAVNVASEYDFGSCTRVYISVFAVLAGTLFLLFFARGKAGKGFRVGGTLAALLCVFPLWKFVFSSNEIYASEKTAFYADVIGWIPTEYYCAKGFVYPFIYSISSEADIAPDGYNKSETQDLLASYRDSDIPADKRVNILAIQLEAFCDLERLGVKGIDPDVYAPFRKLQSESYHGISVTDTYAGGTVRSEHAFLTGDYRYITLHRDSPSYVRYLREQGYHTVGSHPFKQDNYNRINLNRYCGFESYRYLENYYASLFGDSVSPWYSDCALFPELVKELKEYADAGENVFSFNVSMQGHGAYDNSQYMHSGAYWSGIGCSPEGKTAVDNYLYCVADTCLRLSMMIDELRDYDRPVVVLLYGDHKPGLDYNSEIYDDLGINMTPSDLEGFLNLYSTEYLIWANDAAKELTGNDFTGEAPTVSVCYLMNLLFDQLGWGGNSLMKFNRDAMAAFPVLNADSQYIKDGRFITALDSSDSALLDSIDSVQYYLRRSFNK